MPGTGGFSQHDGVSAMCDARRRDPWLLAATGLAGAGGAALLVKAGLAVAEGLVAWSAVIALTGLAGLAAALLTRSRPGRAAASMTAVGVLALVDDLAGASVPPRVLPGAILLVAAAVVAGGDAPAAGRRVPLLARMVAWAGLAGHGVVGVVLLPLGLVAPWWAVIALLVLWGLLLALALRLRRRRPWLVPFFPVTMAAIAAGLLDLGSTVLGWTA
jgi:hypothetical protein